MYIYNIINKIPKLNLILSGFLVAIIFCGVVSLRGLDINCTNKEIKRMILLFFMTTFCVFFSLGLKLLSLWFIVYTLICIIEGRYIIVNILKITKFQLIHLCIEFLLGLYINAVLYFIISHLVGFAYSKIFMILFFIIIIALNLFKRKKIFSYFDRFKNQILKKENYYVVFLVAISLIISYLIVFNYNINYQWSWNDDKTAHLSQTFIKDYFIYSRFPLKNLYPFIFQLALFVPTVFFNGDHTKLLIMSYNFFGYINMFLIFLIPYEFSKKLKITTKGCFLASFLTVFYGALGGPIINSYIGFINISGSMYHNTTQFFAMPLVLLCIYYIYSWVRELNDYNNLILAILFLDISFFIKPSAYMILAPSICILIFVMILKRKVSKYLLTIFSYVLIIIPMAFWVVYPKILGMSKTSTDTCIGKFGEVYLYYFNARFSNLNLSIYKKVFIIVVFSLIGIILVSIFGSFNNKLTTKFYYIFLIPIFMISIWVACSFIENNIRKYDGNFLWQTSLIGCCLMPFIAGLLQGCKRNIMKKIIQFIFYLNIFSGMWHLIMLNLNKTL